jgi:hypothetical protein
MEPLTTTTEPPKNHNTKCQNASKPQKKCSNIPTGNSTELQKARNSTTMPSLASPAGNYPLKSKSIASSWRKREKKIKRKAGSCRKRSCRRPKR